MTLHGVLRKTGRIVLLFFLVTVPLACFLSPDRLLLFPTREPDGAPTATLPGQG